MEHAVGLYTTHSLSHGPISIQQLYMYSIQQLYSNILYNIPLQFKRQRNELRTFPGKNLECTVHSFFRKGQLLITHALLGHYRAELH